MRRLLLVVLLCASIPGARAVELVVAQTGDSGAGSLRAMILAANALPGTHSIVFDIPGEGVHTIQLLSALPAITRSNLTIDGYTQPGASANTLAEGNDAVILIELDGQGLPTGSEGLELRASGITVRGLSIVRFNGRAVFLAGAGAAGQTPISGFVIEGNFLGLRADGSTVGANGGGIASLFGQSGRIGGTTPAARNVISGNALSGISFTRIETSDNRIEGNYIGVAADGVTPRPNNTGVSIGGNSRDNFIGGLNSGAGNRIARNTRDGVTANAGSIRNRILGNEIFGHRANNVAGLGIDLSVAVGNPDGVTPNDPDDADDGGNALQNFPELLLAQRIGDALQVEGLLDRPAGSDARLYTLEFFANASCNGSGHGEGEILLARRLLILPDGAQEAFAFQLNPAPPEGSFLTATATDLDGNTSEFSACIVVSGQSDAVFSDGFETAALLLADTARLPARLATATSADASPSCAAELL